MPTGKVRLVFPSWIVELISRFYFFVNLALSPIPASHRRDIDLMRSWDEEGVEFC